MGLIQCDGSNFFYYPIQMGQIVTTVGSVASVAWSTGVAYRRKISIAYEDVAFDTINNPEFKVNVTSADLAGYVNTQATSLSGAANIGLLVLTGGVSARANASTVHRLSGQLDLATGTVYTTAKYASRFQDSSPQSCVSQGIGAFSATAASITSFGIYPSTGNFTAGTFTIKEL
jgi:hypothetical protein